MDGHLAWVTFNLFSTKDIPPEANVSLHRFVPASQDVNGATRFKACFVISRHHNNENSYIFHSYQTKQP